MRGLSKKLKLQGKNPIAKNFLYRTAGGVLAGLLPWWLSSLDYQVAYHDPIIDPSFATDGRKRIYIFWHEYLQLMIYLRKRCNIAMLLSQHGDADLVEELAHLFGYETVRGSTQRGGARALMELKEHAKNVHLTITPDGPRGPRRVLAAGCVYLSSRLQMPLVLLGIGYDRPYRINSWDRFAIPRYGSRARIIVSGDIVIPEKVDREELEAYRIQVEQILNDLTIQAEDWASRHYEIEGASNVLPGPKNSVLYFAHPKEAESQKEDGSKD